MEKELKQEFTFTREEIIKRNQDIADLIDLYIEDYKERTKDFCPFSNEYIKINTKELCNNNCDECVKKFYKQMKENMREKLLIRIDIE